MAGKVRVQTKKLGSDEAFQWINTGSVECEMSPIRRETVGSTVTVYLRRLFMITPFDDSYKPVETAIRQVFEKAPFYF